MMMRLKASMNGWVKSGTGMGRQVLDAISRPVAPETIELSQAYKTKRVLTQSQKDNLVYAGSSMLLGVLIQSYRYLETGDDNASFIQSEIRNETSKLLLISNVLLAMYVLRKTIRMMLIDNTLYTMTVYKAAASEAQHNQFKQECDSGKIDIVRGSLASVLYYGLTPRIIGMAASQLPFQMVFLQAALMFHKGQSLAEYNVSNQCTECRYHELSKNNGFSFAIGFVHTVLVESSYAAVSMLGLQNPLVYDALWNMWYQYLMVAVMSKPLPGGEKGVDIFYYARELICEGMDRLSKTILPYVHSDRDRTQLAVRYKKIAESDMAVAMIIGMLYPDLFSPEEIVKRRSMDLYLYEQQEILRSTVKVIGKLRKDWFVRMATYIPAGLFPLKYQNAKMVLNILMLEKLGDALNGLRNLVAARDEYLKSSPVSNKAYDQKALSQVDSLVKAENEKWSKEEAERAVIKLNKLLQEFCIIETEQEEIENDFVETPRPLPDKGAKVVWYEPMQNIDALLKHTFFAPEKEDKKLSGLTHRQTGVRPPRQ